MVKAQIAKLVTQEAPQEDKAPPPRRKPSLVDALTSWSPLRRKSRDLEVRR
jgi:hypothetical protein